MTAKVILNPYAGRWKALRQKEKIEIALKSANIDFDLVVTEYPGHGTELASNAVEKGFSPIVSAGGDGSISEVVNGILSSKYSENSSKLPPLGILPLGTANDFAVNLDLPLGLKDCADVIANGKYKTIDAGNVNGRYFDNNSAIGLEPNITLIQESITRLRGVLRYLIAALIGIYQNPSWTMHLEWDSGEYRGPITLVTVGNNPLTGGLFYMTPNADASDGLLTFVYGFMPTRLKILAMLPKTMKPGKGSYVENPNIHEIHTKKLVIHSDQSTPLHADGEIQSKAIQDIEFRIQPACIKLLN